VQVSSEIPDVEVNAAVIELALTNYLGNAIKYCDPNAKAAVAMIGAAIEQGPKGRELVLKVSDNGLGVPPEKRDRLFERYFRAHETMDEAEGTGLGLSIVRETVESIGGRAWAEFPSAGSTFAFALPFRRDEGGERRLSETAQTAPH
jgi:signal transduction histidine kinase